MKRLVALIAMTAALFASQATDASAQAPQIQWRFGMNVKVTSNGFQKALMVKSVHPGSPACRAGLKRGMVILTSNGMNFNQAQNDYHGVALLQHSVSIQGGGGVGGGGVPTTFTSPTGQVHLVVVTPCGSQRHLTCYPHFVGDGGGGGGVPTTF